MSASGMIMLYAPDYTGPEGLQRRLETRAEHIVHVRKYASDGYIKLGGPLLDEESSTITDGSGKMVGTVLIFDGLTLPEVRKFAEEDAFYTGNAWDREKIVILPIGKVPPAGTA